MCGFAGIFHYSDLSKEVDAQICQRMTDSLAHRGPDDSGVFFSGPITLGHRRLSILDLSERGKQPMADDTKQCWIVFNGEIYNFRELRSLLESKGRRFRSETDTEVILQAYLEWGIEAVHRLNGMFAFAIWDSVRKRLWLARDPVGIKPLFYYADGKTLRFGSEIKAILADPAVARQPDLAAIDSFLSFSYTPAPRTGFVGIKQLLPGHSLLVENGQVKISSYYRMPYPDSPPNLSEADAIELLRQELKAAIRRQMVSDVPLGAFLSGGIDSSAVVWGMRGGNGAKVRTFCIGFDEPTFDESPFAREVAQILGAEFTSEVLHPSVADLLPILVSHAEEPFADASMIPLFILSQMTRKHVTVALSGDGGDELLAGYDTYRASRFAPTYRLIPGALRRNLIAPLVQSLPISRNKYGFSMLARRFVSGAEQGPLRDHCSWRQIFTLQEKGLLYSSYMRNAVNGDDPIDDYASTLSDTPDWLSPLEQQLHMDFRFHLANDMLVKVDRMSMAHSLEVRVPLLDLEMIRACLRIPADFKLRGHQTKYILRRCLDGILPGRILRRRKAGFVLPLEAWFRGPLLPVLLEYVNHDFLKKCGLFRSSMVEHIIQAHVQGKQDHAYQLFTLLVLAVWWRIWIDRSQPMQCIRPGARS